jgi:SHS2 domain-containing protein
MEQAESGTYQFLDHAADVGLEVHSPTLTGLFSTAARALLAWMGPVPEGDEFLETAVDVEGEDLEDLLVRWLQEILYLFYQRHGYTTGMRDCHIQNDCRLTATVLYKTWDESRYQDYQEVKAVTYHQLQVRRGNDEWMARFILDL